MKMSPEEMAALQKQAGGGAEAEGGGKATKLVQSVGEGLAQLQGMLAQSQGVTDKDMAQMDQILSLYVDLAEKKLGGQAPGQDEPEPEAETLSQIPADAGMKGKPMGPATRN